MNKETPDFFAHDSSDLLSFDASTTQGNAIVSPVVLGACSSENSLMQPNENEQDQTKPYRILFQGELVHDKNNKENG